MVQWEEVCKPLAHGGLGIRSIEKVNKALLGKWLWRVGNPGQGFWRRLLLCKYKLGNGGWCIPNQDNKVSGLWRSIISAQDDFASWIRYRIHNVRCVKLRHDEWCG